MREEDLEEILSRITDKFTEWDAGVQDRAKASHDALIQKVHGLVSNPTTMSKETLEQINDTVTGLEDKLSSIEKDTGVFFVPFYDKGEEVHSWLRTFESCADFKGYDTKKKIKAFRMLMRNAAATWFESIAEQCKTEAKSDAEAEFKLIITKFKARFSKANEWLREHMIQFIAQKPGQTVSQFYSTLTEKCSKLKKTPKEIMSMFIRGLLPDIKLYVLAREPADLEASFKLAKAGEALETISNVGKATDTLNALRLPGDFHSDTHRGLSQNENISQQTAQDISKSIKQLNDKMEAMQKIYSGNRIRTPNDAFKKPTIKCHYCGILGHRIAECRIKLSDLQRQRNNGRPDRQTNYQRRYPNMARGPSSDGARAARSTYRGQNNNTRYLN